MQELLLLACAISALLVAPSARSADPTQLSCRPAAAVEIEGPMCPTGMPVIQPCSGVLVPPDDLIQCAKTKADLEREQSLRAADATKHQADMASKAQEVRDLLTRLDACEDAGAECRADLAHTPDPWPALKVVAVAALAVAGVSATVKCAVDDQAPWCLAGGLGLGAALGISF